MLFTKEKSKSPRGMMISDAGSKLDGVSYPENEHAQKVVGLSFFMAHILLLYGL